MENIFSMVEGPKPTEITSCDQADQDILQEYLSKGRIHEQKQ